ncbi:MAG: NAD(P)H-binding protein [Rothia sp. (in: high G+C Gram-positive bacteria)]|nr:NAD(P)H-binding protein [Rothia sp. (in: high G+C Gram-positive bacteria)]
MKIAVVGAKGLVGAPVVAEALQRGHQVDAYTRSGAEGSQALDLAQTDQMVEVINSHDATLISVASRDNYQAALEAHQALIAAAPTGRFIVVGGAGSLNAGDKRLYDTPEFPEEYKAEAKTFGAIYDAYLAADKSLAWSMVAPAPMIAPGVRTGDYKLELDTPAGNFVSAEDLAVAIVDEFEQAAYTGKRFTVASADEAAAQG